MAVRDLLLPFFVAGFDENVAAALAAHPSIQLSFRGKDATSIRRGICIFWSAAVRLADSGAAGTRRRFAFAVGPMCHPERSAFREVEGSRRGLFLTSESANSSP